MDDIRESIKDIFTAKEILNVTFSIPAESGLSDEDMKDIVKQQGAEFLAKAIEDDAFDVALADW